jgi:hypothetical protein
MTDSFGLGATDVVDLLGGANTTITKDGMSALPLWWAAETVCVHGKKGGLGLAKPLAENGANVNVIMKIGGGYENSPRCCWCRWR